MKKYIAFALLAVVSSFAAASDLTLAPLNKPNAPVANVSTPAPEATVVASAAAPNALEQGAGKVGAFLGSLMKGPAMMGKAFVSGVSAGYSGDAAAKQATVTTPSSTSEATPSAQAATAQPGIEQNPLAKHLASLIKRVQDQAAAPVDERSTLASNTNY
jgi:hypothetical protein